MTHPQLYSIRNDLYSFPPVEHGLFEGLLQIGGEVNFDSILVAYSNGIFPWYGIDDPIMWFCPIPRLILFPDQFHVSKSLRALLRKSSWTYSIDVDFHGVMLQCKHIERKGQRGTWIQGDIQNVFSSLHEAGLAHSVEIWDEHGTLIGGLYGLAVGKMFCGESMFSKKSGSSKIALQLLCIELIKRNFGFIDCQQETPHLQSLGAQAISLEQFTTLLQENQKWPVVGESWFRERMPVFSED